MRGQRHAPAALYPRERTGTHCTGGCVGPRAGLDRCGKSRPPPGFDPQTVQPIASRYTDYAARPTIWVVIVAIFRGRAVAAAVVSQCVVLKPAKRIFRKINICVYKQKLASVSFGTAKPIT